MARGRWLKKISRKVRDKVDDIKDDVKEKIGKSGGSAFLGGIDLGPACQNIRDTSSKCQRVAQETVGLCDSTKSRSDQVVAFGSEIQQTLQSFAEGGMDASVLETVKDLTDGDRLKAAIELATHMDDVALKCIDKSVEMIDMLEDSMDELPDPLEKIIDDAAEKQASEEDRALLSLKNLDKDVDDVKSCIDAIRHLNIATAFSVGLRAFEQLASKADQSRSMFDSIRSFSTDVESISKDLKSLDVVSLSSRIKDILRIIHLSEIMRKFAEGAKRIIEVVIDLFRAVAERITTLWAALAFAKDCMADCVEHVVKAKMLCLEAKDKSTGLMERAITVKEQLDSVGKMNARSVGTVRELSQSSEIKEAIDLAKNMDDLVLDATKSVATMVDRVTEGFRNLPDILTDGFKLEEDGKTDDDPEPVDVEENIKDLEDSKDAIDSSDIFTACKSGVRGFSSVHDNASTCKDLLGSVESFATNCDSTIASFMSVWDLESVMTKIKEMCRLVSLGELMKQFASQIKRLLIAIIELMKSAMEKLSSLNVKDLGLDDVQDAIENAVGVDVSKITDKVDMDKITDKMDGLVGGRVGDAVDDTMEKMKDKFGGNMKKLGSLFR